MFDRFRYGKQGARDRRAHLQKLQTREMARQVAIRQEQQQREKAEEERIEAERQRRREEIENQRLRAQLEAPPMSEEDWERSRLAYAAQERYKQQQRDERMDRRPDLAGGKKSKHSKSKHSKSKHSKSKHGKSKHGKSKHGKSKHGKTKHSKTKRNTKSGKGTRRN